ncbi:MAG: tRNA 2-selenouridine(34) synthase MnmH [Cellulosilyticaceae bacterium]
MNLPTTNNFHQIVMNQTPLIDVRAPIEYEKGAFIGSMNLPIMNNEERRLVGICYKEKGNEEATKLGHQLVSGAIREQRITAWIKQLSSAPETMIYCFRGGSRSRISQQWITETTGKEILRLEGGYKAFRTYLLDSLEPSAQKSTPIILGGHTGSGKTILLKQLENAIDLEGIANHRGSSFGHHVSPQPSQIDFENNLAYALIHHQAKGYSHMILEDEGRHIGSNFIPKGLFDYFNQGKLVLIDVPLEERVQMTLKEYVIEAQAEYQNQFADQTLGLYAWHDYISSSMYRVKKRLGGDRLKEVLNAFEKAFITQSSTGDLSAHEEWITIFLRDYYDPMYTYQIENTNKEIIFRGSTGDVLSYLRALQFQDNLTLDQSL